MIKYRKKDIEKFDQWNFSDVEIGKILNLHKSTVGKLRKGIIQFSRPIGIKKRYSKREYRKIWEYTDVDYYSICRKKATSFAKWDGHSSWWLLDEFLDYLYKLSDRMIEILKVANNQEHFIRYLINYYYYNIVIKRISHRKSVELSEFYI